MITITPKVGIQVNDLAVALQAALNAIALAYVPNIILDGFCNEAELIAVRNDNGSQ